MSDVRDEASNSLAATQVDVLETRDSADGHADAGRDNPATDPPCPARRLAPGTRVGRYTVLSEIGAGGMGVVHAAFDRELERKVALKVLRSDRSGTRPDASTRLLREAQALARLTHPNVVGVFDAGLYEGAIWIAMEFVAGRTFAQWRRESARSWREIVAVARQVAVGLAAAHDAGLIHRDVKPENVMIADDGRVLLMDFGLARAHEEGVATEPVPLGTGGHRVLVEALTVAGSTPGTPAYMSPEQFMGAALDPNTDQFSFCVMVWEALYGRAPFAGESLGELALAVIEGRRRAAPRARVPGWLHEVLVRGLAVDPTDRWPSMRALLEGMKRGRTRARVRKGVGVAAMMGAIGLGVTGLEHLDRQREIEACTADGAVIDEIWNAERRSQLRAGLLASGAADAADTFDRMVPWITARTDAWREARTESCLDARVRGTWDDDLLDRSVWCLEERSRSIDAVLEQLSVAKVGAVRRAVESAAELPAVEPCRNVERLRLLPPPPAEREQVRAVHRQLARARALSDAGELEQALAEAREASEAAAAVGWPPLSAAIDVVVAMQLLELGENEECARLLESAFHAADRVGAIEVSADAAGNLIPVVGHRLGRVDEARRWTRHARRAVAALGEQHALRGAQVETNLAILDYAAGDYAAAKAGLESALTVKQRVLGADHPALAAAVANLASVESAMAHHAEARALYERGLALDRAALGPGHPSVGRALGNLAGTYLDEGDYDRARALYEEAVDVLSRALGPDHVDVAFALNNLGLVATGAGETERARELLERALALKIAALGPEHPSVASSLTALGTIQQDLGALGEAAQLQARAAAVWEQKLGPEHPNVASALANLGSAQLEAGEASLAEPNYTRALAIYEKALGSDHPDTAFALTGLASIAMLEGRHDEAIARASRALELRLLHTTAPEVRAQTRFLLARVLWDAPAGGGRDRPRARSLAEQARTELAGSGTAKARAELDAWIAEHQGAR